MRISACFGFVSLSTVAIVACVIPATAHTADSSRVLPPKVLHAEPLYIDLIRDLGAHKGESEWNVAFELTDRQSYDKYVMLVEYEWAIADRIGLEIEIPVTLYMGQLAADATAKPANRIESIKTAAQWTFFVDESIATSIAIGAINELEFADIRQLNKGPIFTGNLFNPFLIAAKRWGECFHSLLYTGPRIHGSFADGSLSAKGEANLSLHYMISGTRNFVGLETNSVFDHTSFSAVLRPQMRVSISANTLVGLGVSVPIDRNGDRFGMFMRFIWEPD